MAKLRTGELVLDLNEGQILEGRKYCYVAIEQYTNRIVLTPTDNNDAIDAHEDPVIKEHLLDLPHEVIRLEDAYRINTSGHADEGDLTDYIGENDYTVEAGPTHVNGVIMPKHLVLTVVRATRPEYDDDQDDNMDIAEPTSLEDLDDMLADIEDFDGLKDYAKSCGIDLIKKDWRKTITSKIRTYWKKRGIR